VVKHLLVAGLAVMALAAGAVGQSPSDTKSSGEQYVGTWSGRWDSSGSGGGFELTI
jgi:hypothetical protein